MKLPEVESLMRELALDIRGANVEVGVTDRRRYNDAFLRITSLADPEKYAMVSNNGGAVYELEVTGGFRTFAWDDQAVAYEDVRAYLESFVRAASAYLDGQWSIRRSRIFRTPILTIRTDVAPLDLTLPRRCWVASGSRL